MAQIALGTVQFGLDYGIANSTGQMKWSETEAILDFAFANGITLLDTAAAYGNSERVLGRYLSEKKENNFNIITKIAECESNDMDHYFADSLEKLKKNTVYGLLFHSYKALSSNFSKWDIFEGFKQRGNVEKIGVSLYHPSEWISLKDKGIIPDIVQIPVSLFDQRFIPYFQEMKELLVEIHVRSIFLQGLYFMDTEKLSDFFKPVKESLLFLHTLSNRNEIPIESICFNFVDAIKEIDYIVIGVDSLDQLKKNVNLINSDKKKFQEIKNELGKIKIEDTRMVLPYLWPKKQ